MNASPLRVAVLSPQAVVVEGLRAILATNDEVRLVDLDAGHAAPDLVLYDAMSLVSGDSTGLDAIVDEATTTVLVVSRDLRPGLAAQALAAGADGLVSLGADPDEIFGAITTAVTRRRLRDARQPADTGSVPSMTGEGPSEGLERLTRREAQVMALLGQGRSNAEIAVMLHMSRNTVKTHIRLAYRRIGAKNRAEATAWARAHLSSEGSAT